MSDGTDGGLGSWGTSSSTSYPGSDDGSSVGGGSVGSSNDWGENWGKEENTDYPGTDSWGGSLSDNYTTGGWDDPASDQYKPQQEGSDSFDDPNSFWNRAKRTLFGMGLGKIAERTGLPGAVVGGLASATNAPEGKRLDSFGNSFGNSIINGIIGAIPGVGVVNTISGMLGGPTIGSAVMSNKGGDTVPATSTGRGGPGGNGMGNGFENLAMGLASLYNYNQGNRAINGQIRGLGGLFGQDSPYAQTLRQQLARRDAAGGRRSQYGAREVELQAKLAQLAAGQSGTLNNLYMQQQGLRNQGLNTLMQFGRQSGLFNQIGQGIGGLFQSPYTPDPLFEQTGPDF